MKNTSLVEKIGFTILIFGLILLLANSLTENEHFLKITKHHEIVHWVGLGLWAFGYLQREKKVSQD